MPEKWNSASHVKVKEEPGSRIRQALRGWHVTTKTRPRVRGQGSCEKISWKRTIGGVSHCLYHPCLLLTALLVLSWNKEVLSPWCGLGCGLNAGGHHKQDRCSWSDRLWGPRHRVVGVEGRGTHPDWKADGELARKRKECSRSPGKMGKPGAQERGEWEARDRAVRYTSLNRGKMGPVTTKEFSFAPQSLGRDLFFFFNLGKQLQKKKNNNYDHTLKHILQCQLWYSSKDLEESYY